MKRRLTGSARGVAAWWSLAGLLALLVAGTGGCRRGGEKGTAAAGSAAPGQAAAPHRSFVDSAGRTVQVPATVRRVYPAGLPASILLYTLARDSMIGWPRRPSPEAVAFVPKHYLDLPELGRVAGRGGSANAEELLRAAPDLILDYGSLDPTYRSLADRVQEQTGIPYLLIDGSFEHIPQAYRLLGPLLGVPERAEQLAAYAERVIAETHAAAARQEARPSVYYARGPEGLETGGSGTINVELLDLVGARNVAAAGPAHGLFDISFEQLLQYAPEVILTTDPAVQRLIRTTPRWAALPAVAQQRVWLSPTLPFPWFDHPPSVNRLIGVRWLQAVLRTNGAAAGSAAVPHRPGVAELSEATREFYRLFYQHELTGPEIAGLLAGAAAAP